MLRGEWKVKLKIATSYFVVYPGAHPCIHSGPLESRSQDGIKYKRNELEKILVEKKNGLDTGRA